MYIFNTGNSPTFSNINWNLCVHLVLLYIQILSSIVISYSYKPKPQIKVNKSSLKNNNSSKATDNYMMMMIVCCLKSSCKLNAQSGQ